jgi:hypothetical protein
VHDLPTDKKFSIVKNKPLMDSLLAKQKYVESVNRVFTMYGHTNQYSLRLQNIQLSDSLNAIEILFGQIAKSSMEEYGRACEELEKCRADRNDIYRGMWEDAQGEIGERVTGRCPDGETSYSFSEYHIIRRLGLEHRSDVRYAEELEACREAVAQSNAEVRRIAPLVNRDVGQLISEVKNFNKLLAENRNIAGLIEDGNQYA